MLILTNEGGPGGINRGRGLKPWETKQKTKEKLNCFKYRAVNASLNRHTEFKIVSIISFEEEK